MLYQLLFTLCLIAGLTCFILFSYRQVLHYVHMLQLNSYRNERYSRWLHLNLKKNINFVTVTGLLSIVLASSKLGFLILWGGIYLLLFLLQKPAIQKKPLVITARVKRLLVIIGLTFILPPLLLFWVSTVFILPWIVLSLLLIGLPYLILFSNQIATPIEKQIAMGFVKQAKRTIESLSHLKKIGITGSYGKTSTKYILQQILSSQYHSLMTPESFNTLMGVTRVINENLKPIHNLFIAEMGAKQPGDIKEICDLVKPEISLITTIGEQHLETFKTLENIKKTKGEIIRDLPEQGLAVLNGDNAPSLELKSTTIARVLYFAIDNPKADYRAENIKILSSGITQFNINYHDKQSLFLETRLLGQHNLYNILAAVTIALELGINPNKIKAAVRSIQPAPHRMNVKNTAAGITIIDNAFSTNPSAARSSVDVMAKIEGNRKIMITPGMIELGEIEYEENKRFGHNMPNGLDYVILVGQSKQTQAIQDGLDEAQFPTEQVYLASNLDDANQHLRAIAKAGDVVIYENDLPDNYL